MILIYIGAALIAYLNFYHYEEGVLVIEGTQIERKADKYGNWIYEEYLK